MYVNRNSSLPSFPDYSGTIKDEEALIHTVASN